MSSDSKRPNITGAEGEREGSQKTPEEMRVEIL